MKPPGQRSTSLSTKLYSGLRSYTSLIYIYLFFRFSRNYMDCTSTSEYLLNRQLLGVEGSTGRFPSTLQPDISGYPSTGEVQGI